MLQLTSLWRICLADEISTKEDLLRLWHEDDEFRAASRRELLTDELLELPEKFAENARQVDSRLDRVETRLEHVEIDVDGLRGDALERKAPTHLCQLLNDALSIRRVQVIWMPGGIVTPLHRMDNFAINVESGADDGAITLEEEGRLNRTDMVARAIREPEGTRLWIAAEISGLIGGEGHLTGSRVCNRAQEAIFTGDDSGSLWLPHCRPAEALGTGKGRTGRGPDIPGAYRPISESKPEVLRPQSHTYVICD